MALLTISQLREHIETDIKDAALQRLIDDAEAEIIVVAGELNTETDVKVGDILATALFLKRRAASITTVVEELKQGEGDYVETILASDDYKLRADGRMIERLVTGTNPRTTWGNVVNVTYVPEDDTARRTGCLIDLVKLAAEYTGLESEQIGDYSQKQKKYDKEHEAILGRLRSWEMA